MSSSEFIFKAGLDDVVIRLQGMKLLGGLYRGAGRGPRPTAILLHGVPGVEKNLDIAYALRDKGWNCLYFHYRGSWGSEGDYSFCGALDDVYAATDWILDQRSVDSERLAVVGNSFGGYLALASAASDPRIAFVVSITPLVDPMVASISDELFDEFAEVLRGVSGAELKEQWDDLAPIQSMVPELEAKPILLVTADDDEIFPAAHYEPIATQLKALRWERVAGADHVFSSFRTQLVNLTVDWLLETLGP